MENQKISINITKLDIKKGDILIIENKKYYKNENFFETITELLKIQILLIKDYKDLEKIKIIRN